MKGNSTITTESLTEEELRNAGASATYIAYYQAAKLLGIETNQRILQEVGVYNSR